jgi:hypothetical protein
MMSTVGKWFGRPMSIISAEYRVWYVSLLLCITQIIVMSIVCIECDVYAYCCMVTQFLWVGVVYMPIFVW